MRQIDSRKIHRVMDANFNRAKEGLRVCEDLARFFLNSPALTRQLKDVRHQLTESMGQLKLKSMLEARDAQNDVGRQSTKSEFKRNAVEDIFYANMQRVKESIRVLEEFTKLLNIDVAESLKDLRYVVYKLEKKVAQKF